ncbi:metal ABC transporter solute-binding protein, Zn/Mn family [Pseudogracilibacillus sp. SO30301A]|uniref:metal ABC transporter solute-binding protein, Zn/Mn family n=1 Tax=Pseudogracilibacillus sp. SO30301A TaxID=3098291 RepID=UPI00300E4CBD
MKFIKSFVFLLFLVFVTVGCSSTNEDTKSDLTIYTTVYPLQYIVEEIGGDTVTAHSVYPPGADGHTYEPTSKEMGEFARSDAFIYIGEGMEGFAESISSALGSQDVKLIEIGKHEELFHHEHADHDHDGHNHEHGDDHDHEGDDHDHDGNDHEHRDDHDHDGHNHEHGDDHDHEGDDHDHDGNDHEHRDDHDHDGHNHEHGGDHDHDGHNHEHGDDHDHDGHNHEHGGDHDHDGHNHEHGDDHDHDGHNHEHGDDHDHEGDDHDHDGNDHEHGDDHDHDGHDHQNDGDEATTAVSINGLADHYHTGDTIELTAKHNEDSDYDHWHWFTRNSDSEEWEMAEDQNEGTYEGKATISEQQIKAELYDDNHELVAESNPVTIVIDDHEDHDPHIWTDPLRVIKVAEIIKEELIELNPNEEALYNENFDALKSKLTELDERYKNLLDTKENKHIIVSHAAFGYWEERYGIEQIPISGLSSSEEPSQKALTEVIKAAEEYNLDYVLYEQNSKNRLSEIIQDQIGAEAVMIHNLEVRTEEDIENEKDYIELMDDNLKVLDKTTK